MARKTAKQTATARAKNKAVGGRPPRRAPAPAGLAGARTQALRAISELSDPQKLEVFEAVQATLRAHGVGNSLAELHFASDELVLVCKDGEVRRTVAFRCGPGVCTKSVCVPAQG